MAERHPDLGPEWMPMIQRGHCVLCMDVIVGPFIPNYCGACERTARDMRALGTAIARFVRRAEVAELVEATQSSARMYACWDADFYAAPSDNFRSECAAARDESWRAMNAALSRLAALAIGGE